MDDHLTPKGKVLKFVTTAAFIGTLIFGVLGVLSLAGLCLLVAIAGSIILGMAQ